LTNVKSVLKNNVGLIVLSVPFVHHTELQNFLIAPRNYRATNVQISTK